MKSIFLRNFIATALLVFISFLIIAVAFVGIGRSYVISDYRRGMENSAREVARTAAAIARDDSLSSWVLRMSISSIGQSTGDHVFIADDAGVIVSCSDRTPVCEHMGQQLPEEMIAQIGAGPYDQLTDLGGLYHSRRYVAAMPIVTPGDGTLLGYAFVSNQVDKMLDAWSTFLMIATVVGVGVFFAALLVTLIYSSHMAKPIDEMAAASRKFARGDFSVTCPARWTRSPPPPGSLPGATSPCASGRRRTPPTRWAR